MKHHEYNNWIVSRGTLTGEQLQELESHLQACADCAMFAEAERAVALLLQDVQPVLPRPGFRQRFEQRLADRRAVQHKRQISITLGLSAILALLLGGGVIVSSLMLLLSSDNLIIGMFQDLFQILQVIVLFGSAGKALLGSAGGLVDPQYGYMLAAAAGGLCLLWFGSLYRIRSIHGKRE